MSRTIITFQRNFILFFLISLVFACIRVDTTTREFMKAIAKGDINKVQSLLNAGVSPNIIVGDITALQLASYTEKGRIVTLLLDSGADVNEISPTIHNTALMEAARKGNIEIMKILLNRGADPDIQNAGSVTALMLAANGGYQDAVKTLLENKASIYLKDSQDKIALDYAKRSENEQSVRFLENHGKYR